MGKKINDGLTAKQRYFKKVYDNAPMIECACGCGELIKSKDKYARDVTYVNGHNNRKYDDPGQHKREWNHRNREKRQAYKKEYITERRRKLVDEAGGKCVHCGIEHDGKNTVIFDFHHRDPSTKSFEVSKNYLNRYGMDKILSEVEKCDLLCSNCHRLHHWVEKE